MKKQNFYPSILIGKTLLLGTMLACHAQSKKMLDKDILKEVCSHTSLTELQRNQLVNKNLHNIGWEDLLEKRFKNNACTIDLLPWYSQHYPNGGNIWDTPFAEVRKELEQYMEAYHKMIKKLKKTENYKIKHIDFQVPCLEKEWLLRFFSESQLESLKIKYNTTEELSLFPLTYDSISMSELTTIPQRVAAALVESAPLQESLKKLILDSTPHNYASPFSPMRIQLFIHLFEKLTHLSINGMEEPYNQIFIEKISKLKELTHLNLCITICPYPYKKTMTTIRVKHNLQPLGNLKKLKSLKISSGFTDEKPEGEERYIENTESIRCLASFQELESLWIEAVNWNKKEVKKVWDTMVFKKLKYLYVYTGENNIIEEKFFSDFKINNPSVVDIKIIKSLNDVPLSEPFNWDKLPF